MIFKSKPRVTQYFAANPDFYSQFGLFGHEGIDMVPTDSDWNVYSWFSGMVIRKYTSSVYGETVIIHEEDKRLSWRLAHMSKIYIYEGATVEHGQLIGVMGDTPSGRAGIDGLMKAHLHINCVPMTWDKKDFPLNGFKGRVDPLGVLRDRGEL